MTARSLASAAFLAAGIVACHGCSDSSTGPAYDPDIPTEWAAAVTNEWFPLTPGTIDSFAGTTDAGFEEIVVEVLAGTKVIMGVTATIVHDQVYLNDELIEDTFDWYAQDAAGNVWYFGEDSKEIENGVVISTAGSWEAGVNGAQPGIIMLADPTVGVKYQQELAVGVAEDMARVRSLSESVEVPYGSFDNCLQTFDFTPLDRSVREYKYYARGVGLVLTTEEKGNIRDELVSVKH